MFHSLLPKIGAVISGVLSVIFPFFHASTINYSAVSSTTPKANIEISTTTPIQTERGATTTQATSKLTKKTVQETTTPIKTKTIVEIPVPVKSPLVVLTQAQLSAIFDQINTLTRATLVNILCTTQSSSPFSAASGSGVVISSDGVIVTNAHIGQFFLLKNFNNQKDSVDCTIRIGSPAYPAYKAELVYISPTWINDNKKVLTEQEPTGTGEHDYAFLKIISNIDGTPVTEKLPYMSVNIGENANVGDNTLLDSYPAGFLGGVTIEKDLYQTSAITQISKLFTFATGTVDLLSIPGTVVSQRGSSGGAAVNDHGELIGIITTSSDGDTTGERDLRAITMAYINRDLIVSASIDLKTILENSQEISDTFNQTIAETLTKTLTDAILGK